MPALLLFTGASARIRDRAAGRERRWPLALAIYLVVFLLVIFIADLPLAFYAGYVRPHAYSLSHQTAAHWFSDALKSLIVPRLDQIPPFEIPGLLIGYPFVLLIYWLLRKSPRRWWLYMGLGTVPIVAALILIEPVWIDPLFHRYGPPEDPTLATDILRLARKAGIDNVRVFEVDMSRETTTMNAAVVGFLATRRIVIWDTTVKGLSRPELLTVVAHEMGHYALGHVYNVVILVSATLLVLFGLVHRSAGPCIRRFRHSWGFERLDDIASLPLILLLLNLWLLLLLPAPLAVERWQEHEADRFALELTRDNHSAASAFLKLGRGGLAVPRHGWLYTAWRDTHPPIGDRVDFFNEYRPWERQ